MQFIDYAVCGDKAAAVLLMQQVLRAEAALRLWRLFSLVMCAPCVAVWRDRARRHRAAIRLHSHVCIRAVGLACGLAGAADKNTGCNGRFALRAIAKNWD